MLGYAYLICERRDSLSGSALTLPAQCVVHLLYGENHSSVAYLVPWLALVSILQVAMSGTGIGLKAMESPASVFLAYCGAAAVTLLVGIPLTWAFGVQGAISAMVLSYLVALATAQALLRRKAKNSTTVAG